jgi:hypothetical protein
VNLAKQQPDKLRELQELWWEEAAKYGALPIFEAPGGRNRAYDQILTAPGR